MMEERMSLNTKDYYSILQVPPSATIAEIRAAYRKLAHEFHPDKTNNDLYSTQRFELIKEAYEVLTNPFKKSQYLQQRWYDRSMGRNPMEAMITPFDILKKSLALDRYVATLDANRLDRDGLFEYICELLTDENIEKLNAFNEPSTNGAILTAILSSGRHFYLAEASQLNERLRKLNADDASKDLLDQYLSLARDTHRWNLYRPWLILLVVVLICLLILLAGNQGYFD